MVGRVLRVSVSAAVVALCFVVPSLVVASAPASADSVVNGCTIVSNPTASHFTNCPNWQSNGANLDGVDLAYADLAGAIFDACTEVTFPATPTCVSSDFVGSNLSFADLAGADFGDCNVSQPEPANVACGVSDLTDANLTGSNLTNANFWNGLADEPPFPGATLTGANLTGTILVPPNQTVAATSPAGATVTWTTPAGLEGATPGTCTPASGSTFPLFTTTVTCQVLDAAGDVATGTFQVTVSPTPQYSTRLIVPSATTTMAGTQTLDALAGDAAGISKVQFAITGGSYNQSIIGTATLTLYGYVFQWNTTTVPSGTYTLQSVATDSGGNVSYSSGVTVNVNNTPPSTAVLIPSNGGSVSGTAATLDASASDPNGIAKVQFALTGGSYNQTIIGTGTATLYGYLAQWNTTTVPNGTYSLQSVATDKLGNSGSSAAVTVTVANTPTTAVLVPSTGATVKGSGVVLDASASRNVSTVVFELSGGTLTDQPIATATLTLYGWIAEWDSTSVPDGTYSLQTVATSGGVSGTSAPITVTVGN